MERSKAKLTVFFARVFDAERFDLTSAEVPMVQGEKKMLVMGCDADSYNDYVEKARVLVTDNMAQFDTVIQMEFVYITTPRDANWFVTLYEEMKRTLLK